MTGFYTMLRFTLTVLWELIIYLKAIKPPAWPEV